MELWLLDIWTVPLCKEEVPKSKLSPLCLLGSQSVWPVVVDLEEGSCVLWVSMQVPWGLGREVATGVLEEGSDPGGGHLHLEEAVLIPGCFSSSHPWGRKVDTRDTLRHQGEMAGSATHPSLPAKRSASAHPAKPMPPPASLHKRMPKT